MIYSSFPFTTAGLIALAVQFLLPLLVGLVTKLSTGEGFKAVLLLLLSAVTQFLTSWGTAGWRELLWNIGLGFAFSVAIHFGLWRPTGASEATQKVGIADR